jgi:hypothetical protein
MGRTRRVALLIVLCAATGVAVALPARATGVRYCQVMKGHLALSPGLSNVPTDQTITVHARLSGCSLRVGSGTVSATITASQATCATLTAAMQPTTATIGWADGPVSVVSLTFSSQAGAPDRLAVAGTVVSGVADGEQVGGRVHLRATYSRLIRQPGHRHRKGRPIEVLQHRPLSSDPRDCNIVNPVTTVDLASSQKLSFVAPAPTATATTAAGPHVSATTTAAPLAHHTARTLPHQQRHRRHHRRAARGRFVALNDNSGPSGSGSSVVFDVLFGVFIGLCLCGLILLLRPWRLFRPQTTPTHRTR